jgi:ferredoxin
LPVRTATGEKFREVELSEEALGADAIINLPKLKTHSQMDLTLAVKNFFGCVVGLSKGEWHMRVGENRELFAELLVSIYKAMPPSVSLIDGILSLEGDGPGTGGTPRSLGVLIGSRNAPALDEVVCRMIGYEPSALLTNKAARSMGLTAEFTVEGALPDVKGFIVPRAESAMFGPGFMKGLLRHHLTVRPECVDETCELCEECIRMCPADALDMEDTKLRFDYDLCIRCYCCLEVCPHGALKKRDPLLRRIIKKFF